MTLTNQDVKKKVFVLVLISMILIFQTFFNF
jgi:hypothetical protein